MKKILPLSLLMIFIAACASPTPSLPPTLPPVIENPTLPPTIQFTPIPTLTVAPPPTEGFPTFVPPTTPLGQITVIQFPTNGTYVDVPDSLVLGERKTYSINAMKGQVMSVSVLPRLPSDGWGYVPMQIKGADGAILCPQTVDSDCIAWRGALPSTQDYFVTLSAFSEIPQYVMRIAVNPPGQDAQYFQYHNPATGLSLTYSDEFAPMLPVVGNYKTKPELALYLNDPQTYKATNLGEAYLLVSSTSDPQVVSTCADPNPNGDGLEQIVENGTVNGFTFVHSTAQGVGAGNLYEQEIYRMVNNNVCYEVIYYLHSSNIGNYTPGTVAEFDRNAIIQKLNGVFATFAIK